MKERLFFTSPNSFKLKIIFFTYLILVVQKINVARVISNILAPASNKRFHPFFVIYKKTCLEKEIRYKFFEHVNSNASKTSPRVECLRKKFENKSKRTGKQPFCPVKQTSTLGVSNMAFRNRVEHMARNKHEKRTSRDSVSLFFFFLFFNPSPFGSRPLVRVRVGVGLCSRLE